MADFVAVLKKTIGGLRENTPEMREKVYEKARATIEAKLAAISPPPPQAVIDRQRKAIDDAIAVVRAEYDAPEELLDDDDLEDVFSSLEKGEVPASPVTARAEPETPHHETGDGHHEDQFDAARPDDDDEVRSVGSVLREANDAYRNDASLDDSDPASMAPPVRRSEKKAARNRTGLIAALAALLVLAGAGYAAWLNRNDISALLASWTQTEPSQQTPETAGEESTAAAPSDAAPEAQAQQPAQPEEQPKFTQRLMPDGNEVDEGPAGGTPAIGEGSSVAQVSPDAPGQAAETPAAPSNENATEDPPAVAVGQRAIFYEERTSSAQGSAEAGSIVWSLVQESPGGDLPPEPAVRAEATIPGKNLQMRMTIRRNADQTLPASHIIEMIFLTPEGFEGGGISNVTRIALKETEQAAGNPLVGIPAKIADGFFLVALSDSPAEMEANTSLLRRQSWIDIPLVYQSGRRALITLEKGIPGERVFDEAMRAWASATSG
ncbi:hypothetical protein [Aquamicrobium sp. LC103]|uniref:hypothetical protein n=1 Tax=Aquamicrobium sp. LC103 TaxID=1120658 RepID=UPI00063E9D8A|nr:hypothetical protein [Aquamicrobium sp. LC103]TKT75345.1 hypothetical protein XW59_019655 [Aquamicrobium sp. LC103]